MTKINVNFVSFLLTCNFFISYSANNYAFTMGDLPSGVWCKICHWMNKDIEEFEYYNMNNKTRAKKNLIAIQRIIPLTLVCKKLHNMIIPIIDWYLNQVTMYFEPLGGKGVVLYESIKEGPIHNRSLIQLCCKLGADINTTQDQHIDTLFTHAIRRGDSGYNIKELIELGVNPMCPNKNGEIPIDIAYDTGQLDVALILKDSGGDPDNRYGIELERRHGYPPQNVVYQKTSYGRYYGLTLLAQKEQAKKSNDSQSTSPLIQNQSPNASRLQRSAPVLSKKPVIMVAIGVAVGWVGCWIYMYMQENKEAQEDNKLISNETSDKIER